MKAVVQRVNSARVQIGDQIVGKISRGLLIYLGVAHGDGPEPQRLGRGDAQEGAASASPPPPGLRDQLAAEGDEAARTNRGCVQKAERAARRMSETMSSNG